MSSGLEVEGLRGEIFLKGLVGSTNGIGCEWGSCKSLDGKDVVEVTVELLESYFKFEVWATHHKSETL